MLTPSEADRLLLFTQAQLARARKDRGLRLNAPEATALIADAVCEWARDGLDLPTVRSRAKEVLSVDDVLPGVEAIVEQVRVEARFDDGTRLVVVNNPFGTNPEPSPPLTSPVASASLLITNASVTAIGVSSHVHLAEVNPRLRLDRGAAFGMRLAQPTGDALWILPGETVEVQITPISGERIVMGNTGVVDGPLDDPEVKERALLRLRECGYLDIVEGVDVNSPDSASDAVARLMRTGGNDDPGRPVEDAS